MFITKLFHFSELAASMDEIFLSCTSITINIDWQLHLIQN